MDNAEWADGYEAGLEQGYAERDKTAKNAEKQARAEVLAACLAKIRERYNRLPGFDDASPELFDLIKEIKRLQPAAADLEELLRPGRELAEVVLEHWGHLKDPLGYVRVELEKARAIKAGK